MSRPLRIALVVNSLRAGGAERAVSLLSGHLAARGHRTAVVTIDGRSSDFYDLAPSVERHALDQKGASANAWRALLANRGRIRALRGALLGFEPEVVFSFVMRTSVLTACALGGTRVPLVVSERIDPRRQPLPRLWRTLGQLAYRRAARIVANSREVRDWMAGRHGEERTLWIPNMVDPPGGDLGEAPFPLPPDPFVLSLGRLAPQKAQGLLLEAFARSAPPEWSLVFVGEGPERAALEARVAELGLADRVHLPGLARDPWPVLRRAALFALPSRYEGFPNALLEAQAAGCAAVATDTGSGSRELIVHGESGLLVPVDDAGALAEALGRLMGDAEERRAMGAAARRGSEVYRPEPVVSAWETLARSLAP